MKCWLFKIFVCTINICRSYTHTYCKQSYDGTYSIYTAYLYTVFMLYIEKNTPHSECLLHDNWCIASVQQWHAYYIMNSSEIVNLLIHSVMAQWNDLVRLDLVAAKPAANIAFNEEVRIQFHILFFIDQFFF